MTSELIVIEQTNAVAVLSTDDGINALLRNVRANIDSMGGGSMKNKSSRKKIRSNAFAATKAYKDINEKTIEPLIADLTKKIQPQLDVINAVKANQSVLQSGLQQIRKDVNADVDKFEADLQRVEDEKIEAERVAAVDRDYDFAKVLYNEYLSQVLLGESKIADMKKRAFEKSEKERIAREKKIAEDAALNAKLKAEDEAKAEKQRLIDVAEQLKVDAENQRKAAIQAERDADIAEEKRLEAIETAKQDAIKATALLAKQAADNEVKRIAQAKENERLADEAEQRRIKEKADAEELAETNRLAAIEQTRIDEAKKISDKKLADDQAAATRKANQEYTTKIKTGIKLSLMEHANLSEDDAIATVKALWAGKIASTSVSI
jgi:hypothetical protein